jgi:hypothetical protein
VLVDGSKNGSCQINLKDTSFDSLFYADSESAFILSLKVFFEFKTHRIPPKMAMVPVKTTFLNIGKKRKKSAL